MENNDCLLPLNTCVKTGTWALSKKVCSYLISKGVGNPKRFNGSDSNNIGRTINNNIGYANTSNFKNTITFEEFENLLSGKPKSIEYEIY